MAIFTGIKKAKMFLATPEVISTQSFEVGRCISKFVGSNSREKTKEEAAVAEDERPLPADPRRPVWVPHPHTGIYFPKGQEWVMDDIPNHAASFDQTFWLRNTDGVDDDKPN